MQAVRFSYVINNSVWEIGIVFLLFMCSFRVFSNFHRWLALDAAHHVFYDVHFNKSAQFSFKSIGKMTHSEWQIY